MEFIIVILLIIITIGVYLQSSTGRDILDNLKQSIPYIFYGIFYLAVIGLIIFSLLNLTDEEIPDAIKSWSNFRDWLLTSLAIGLIILIIYKIKKYLLSREVSGKIEDEQ